MMVAYLAASKLLTTVTHEIKSAQYLSSHPPFRSWLIITSCLLFASYSALTNLGPDSSVLLLISTWYPVMCSCIILFLKTTSRGMALSPDSFYPQCSLAPNSTCCPLKDPPSIMSSVAMLFLLKSLCGCELKALPSLLWLSSLLSTPAAKPGSIFCRWGTTGPYGPRAISRLLAHP